MGVDNMEPLIYLKDSALFKTLKRTGSPRLYEQRLWSLFVWTAGDCLEMQVQLTEIIKKVLELSSMSWGSAFPLSQQAREKIQDTLTLTEHNVDQYHWKRLRQAKHYLVK